MDRRSLLTRVEFVIRIVVGEAVSCYALLHAVTLAGDGRQLRLGYPIPFAAGIGAGMTGVTAGAAAGALRNSAIASSSFLRWPNDAR